jgi:YesN/AraC family two-component response regulator
MPGITGVELVRILRARHPGLRAVLLTAYGDDETCREALAAETAVVLTKPVRVMDLALVLDDVAAL